MAQVIIRVLDINDRTPEFADLPYIFRVKENDLTGYIGRVHVITFILLNLCIRLAWNRVSSFQAKDADIEKNSQISYSLPLEPNFSINSQTGEIKANTPLDYEKERVRFIRPLNFYDRRLLTSHFTFPRCI